MFEPLFHDKQPFLFANVAVIICAIYIGLGPALLCLALSLLVTVPLFMSPTHSLELGMDAVFGIISYTLAATVICILAHRQQKFAEHAEESASEVRRLNEELEERVRQRTTELEEANAELAGFTYSIAHDMRQYLRGINVNAHTIVEDQMERLDEDGKVSLQSLGRNARHASELVDGLLEFSRLGKNDLHRTTLDISALASAISSRIVRHQRDTAVHFQIQPGVKAFADSSVLEIALQNLFENAVKYREPGHEPHVELGCLEKNGEAIYYVKDDGIGFDMKFVDHIFLPFERLHRHSEYPGTGIGLANVRRIVEKHGGRVWAQSSPGKGATFFFTLGESEGSRLAA